MLPQRLPQRRARLAKQAAHLRSSLRGGRVAAARRGRLLLRLGLLGLLGRLQLLLGQRQAARFYVKVRQQRLAPARTWLRR